MEKVNGYPKSIDLEYIFRNFFMKNKKSINFFRDFQAKMGIYPFQQKVPTKCPISKTI